MNKQHLRWWDISGQSESDTIFVHIVEATSRKKVIRRFGGTKQCKDFDGTTVSVTFPRDQGQIRVHANDWFPGTLTHLYVPDTRTIVELIRAPRYKCECGEVHISEGKYPSVWCSCGKKAYPVVDASQKKQQDIQPQERFPSMLERPKRKDIRA
ncbi:hypothetical protein SAMN04489725_11063 [Alicyclobacillus hesperidum]|uniref:Uncharacterized protein n=1 Tax=Alicyclobacillus hesperidum TaxID=89784 RepID=A0A1H2VBG7_9BACL|nr:hypothetical protein [Alicyclobacillus hesperidum]SDW65254.1 hypothetical protein SAMN04489725_11063 [Alicyclobacillus hesperidum]